MRRKLRPRAALAQLTLALLTAACGLAFAPAFGGLLHHGSPGPARLLIAIAVGALVPAAAVAVCLWLRAGVLVAALAAVAASGVAIAVATRCGTAVFGGGRQLLSTTLPAIASPAATGVVASVVALASTIAALLAGYAPVRAIAILPSLACLAAALALDAGYRFPPTWLAGVVVGLAAASLALLADRPARDPATTSGRLRLQHWAYPLTGAAVVAALAGLLAAAASGSLPGVRQAPAAAQNLLAPQLRPRSTVDPMAQYPAFADGSLALRLRGSSSARLSELPMVTLSTFTGQTWTTGTRFRHAGTTLPAATAAHPVTVSISAVDARALSWLVRPDQPARVDLAGLGYDPASGDLVVPSGRPYPRDYRVVGAAPQLATTAERDDTPVPWSGPTATDPVAVPAPIQAFATRMRPVGSPYLQLVNLQNVLRQGAFQLAAGRQAPSGSGYAQLATLLAAGSDQRGTSEQFASAFAVTARLLGYDSRLVLGFQPHYARDGRSFTVTGADVHVWAQVRFARAGWVSFDPTPTALAAAHQQAPAGAGNNPRRAPVPSSQPTRSPGPALPKSPTAGSSSGGTPTLPAGIAAAALLLCLATPPAVKAQRRYRRRRADAPALAVYGAWQEAGDRLAEVGVRVRRGRSTADVTASAPGLVREQIRALGALVDRAGYAPDAPAPADATAAWGHLEHVVRLLRTIRPRWRRALAAVDPRPLRRR